MKTLILFDYRNDNDSNEALLYKTLDLPVLNKDVLLESTKIDNIKIYINSICDVLGYGTIDVELDEPYQVVYLIDTIKILDLECETYFGWKDYTNIEYILLNKDNWYE